MCLNLSTIATCKKVLDTIGSSAGLDIRSVKPIGAFQLLVLHFLFPFCFMYSVIYQQLEKVKFIFNFQVVQMS